jgi:hypothetical protein
LRFDERLEERRASNRCIASALNICKESRFTELYEDIWAELGIDLAA